MVLIGGTTLKATDLPLCELVEYVVETEQSVLEIKLKTIAKSTVCVKVYLHVSQKGIVLMPLVADKVEYFNDDKELIDLLQNSSDGTNTANSSGIIEDDQVESIQVEDVIPEFSDDVPEVEPVSEVIEESSVVTINIDKDNGVKDIENISSPVPKIDLVTVNTDLPDAILEIPSCGDDTDSLRILLQSKDEIIAQKDGTIQELTKKYDDIFATFEKEMIETCNAHQKEVEEANKTIELLKQTVNSSNLSDEENNFLKFINYAKNGKAAIREGMSHVEIEKLGKLSSPLSIFAAGAGESMYSMLSLVAKLADSNEKVLIVDFLNDTYWSSRFRWRLRGTIFNVANGDLTIKDIVKKDAKAEILPGTVFNDIALLTIDWVDLLKKIMDYAKGRHVIMLFGNVNNFSTRYTIEKLASVGSLSVFVKASPLNLTSTYSDLGFLPNNKVKLVVLDYVDLVKPFIQEINKTYAIKAFSKSITWDKLGIK